MAILKTDGARLLYTWLLPNVDINGCFSADLDVIRGQIFTRLKRTRKIVKTYLDDLARTQLIILYQSNGDEFLFIPDFTIKQPSLNPKREAKTTIPLPTLEQLKTYSGPTPDFIRTSKVKESKAKQSKDEEKGEVKAEKTDPPVSKSFKKTKLFPIKGKTCSKRKCHMPAVYKTKGDYPAHLCADCMPDDVKEKFE